MRQVTVVGIAPAVSGAPVPVAVPVAPLLVSTLVVAALLALTAGPVAAQPCERPDLLDAVPVEGATGIATDARLEARYPKTATYLGEPVRLTRAGEEGVDLEAEFDPVEGSLTVRPPAPLSAGQRYVVKWPELRSQESSMRGLGKTITFTVGTSSDRESPRFEGLTSLDWDIENKQRACDEGLVARHMFRLALGAAEDDGGRGGLTLVVFQTKGPRVGESPRPVLTQALPSDGRVTVRLREDESVGRVCFGALVRDLAGRTSPGASREQCADPIAGPFFTGCALGGTWGAQAARGARSAHGRPSGPGFGPLGGIAALAVLLLVRRHRARGA